LARPDWLNSIILEMKRAAEAKMSNGADGRFGAWAARSNGVSTPWPLCLREKRRTFCHVEPEIASGLLPPNEPRIRRFAGGVPIQGNNACTVILLVDEHAAPPARANRAHRDRHGPAVPTGTLGVETRRGTLIRGAPPLQCRRNPVTNAPGEISPGAACVRGVLLGLLGAPWEYSPWDMERKQLWGAHDGELSASCWAPRCHARPAPSCAVMGRFPQRWAHATVLHEQSLCSSW
jgi:hypothetical protein